MIAPAVAPERDRATNDVDGVRRAADAMDGGDDDDGGYRVRTRLAPYPNRTVVVVATNR